MNSKFKAAIASAVLASIFQGAIAETYDGVLRFAGSRTRAQVHSEGVAASIDGNRYADAGDSGTLTPLVNPKARSVVQHEAVVEAHSKNQNEVAKSFYNSVIPEQFKKSSPVFRRQDHRAGSGD